MAVNPSVANPKGAASQKHVAVLMGGWSSERPVSLNSGRECADNLEAAGYRVTRIDVERDIAEVLAKLKPDVVFNALHGPYGEDGTIQGVLEILGIPYTHSGVLASALAMNKVKAKSVAAAAACRSPNHRIVSRFDAAREHVLPPPYVVKPIAEGSSFGVLIVKEDQKHPPQSLGARRLDVRRRGDGRAIHRRARAHLRGAGRPRARRDGDHPDRARASTITTQNTPRADQNTSARPPLNRLFTKMSKGLRLKRIVPSAAAASPAPTSGSTRMEPAN